MRGLVEKNLRETGSIVIGVSLAMFLAVALLTHILPSMQAGIEQFAFQVPGLKRLLSGLLGLPTLEQITAPMLLAVVWAHPVVMAILWSFEVYFCTRFPVGEIDRGTIDILLGWPLSRAAIYGCETVLWVVWGGLILGCGWAGFLLSSHPNTSVALVVANLYLVYLATGGMAFLVSALSDRRGPAVGLLATILLATYLLNFLVQFWPPAASLAPLSLLHYYQPGNVLLSGSLPIWDILILAGLALFTWALGGVVVSRRSLCTT